MPTCRSLIQARDAFAALAAAALISLAACGTAAAAGGHLFSLPLTPKNPSGLTLKIDARGIDANGYRPLFIEIAPTSGKPLVADRQLRFVLAFSKYGSNSLAQIQQIIELPEGSTVVKATVLVPQSASWTNLQIETYEGGEMLLDLSQENLRYANSNGWSWTEARPSLLFIDSHVPPLVQREAAIQALQTTGADPAPTFTLPDVRPLLKMFPDIGGPSGMGSMRRGPRGGPVPNPAPAASGTQISDTALLSLIGGRSRTDMIGPAELPTRWIELSQFDVAAISLADLQLVAKTHAPQLAALRDWLATGPVLIVSGVGQEYEHLANLEKLLDLPPLPKHHASTGELRYWTAPDKQDDKGELRTPFDETGQVVSPAILSYEEAKANSSRAPQPQLDSPPFVFRRAKLGCVVAVASDKPFPGQQKDWSWVFDSIPDSHWKWFRRTGFSLSRTNNDYWKFLIPGVGQAPVISFLLLVSLFALAIGPLNYWLLGRARRLYLLLLTVPAGAALVTAALFVFALLSDGISTRLRVRSYADLDQRTGRAAVWSRQSYYAGIAPSQGLVFPADAAVFPLLHEPGALGRDRSTLLVWDGGQQLKQGYLASRTASQFVVCRATSTAAKIIVAEQAAGQPPKIENRLETPIHYLLLRDSRGDYFAGESVPRQSMQPLEAIDLAAATAAMKRRAAAVEPELPYPDYNPDRQNDNMFMSLAIRRSRMANSDSGASEPSMGSSLLEKNIADALQPLQSPLAPGTYIAIVEHSPLVLTGVTRAREEASFHMIRGRY
jgi:hypothetical protein